MLAIINQTQDFIDKISSLPNSELITKIFNKLPENIIETAIQFKNVKKLNYENCVHIDDLLRFKSNLVLSSLLRSIYYIDVYYSISEVVEKRNFVFAEVVEGRDNYLNMKGVYHPKLKNGIGNDITIDEDHNIVFLTGANMAGKSTIMKSISIALYVAHVGFPVAAEKMEFTIQGGMYTTINLADNINVGYSHFYSEVMRLKRVSQEVSQTANLFIIFDELFRGTNVKDAYDATIAVVEAFSTIRECTFIVSTHIIEAGEVLKEKCPNMQFLYMPTVMENGVPRYLYKAKEGITEDRHGMVIINNEKIIDILEQSYKE